MANNSNQIELLIALNANTALSKSNIDQTLLGLKKYYDRNPLLINVDFNRTLVLNNFNKMIAEMQGKKINLDVNLNQTGNTGGIQQVGQQATQAGNAISKSIESTTNKINVLENNLKRIGSIYKDAFNPAVMRELERDILKAKAALSQVSNPQQLTALNSQLSGMTNRMRDFGTQTANASRQTSKFGDHLTQAFSKFPIWMFSATLFYAPIRGFKDLTEKVIELDTALVSLARVSDIPEYQLNTVLERSIDNVRTLSGEVGNYLELLQEFSRTGKNDVESMALANTATVLQNISDLNASETFSTLTAASIAFNKTSEESIEIADKLNEVDNNFAITTKDLALSMNKAATTASTYGVSLEQLLGYTTAIGASTRESGNIVGNSLKTLFSRINTLPKAAQALEAVGVSIREIDGTIRPVGDTIEELGQKWSTLTKEQQQYTSINVAGAYQQNRFNALMLNYAMAVDSSNAAINSQNSAMREQEIYSKSLEARINRLNTEWYNFANSASSNGLYDIIVVTTAALQSLTSTGEGAVSSIGLLAPVFGILGVALFAIIKPFRTYVGTLIVTTKETYAASGATGVLSGTMAVASTATKVLTGALRGLLIATGVGAAFAVLGFALEKVIGLISDSVQATEDFDNYVRKNTEALTTNKDAVEDLLGQYRQLTDARTKDGWDSTKEEEYLGVQQTLSEMFPALISHIDASGQAHLKATEEINKEIQATKELAKAQDQLSVDGVADKVTNMLKDIEGNVISKAFGVSLQGKLEEEMRRLDALLKNGASRKAISEVEYEIAKLEKQIADSMAEITGEVLTATQALQRLNGVTIDSELIKSTEAFLRSLDLSGLDKSQVDNLVKEFAKAQEEIQKAIKAGNEVDYSKAVKSLNDLAKASGAGEFREFAIAYEDMVKAIANGEPIFIDGEGNIEELGESAQMSANGLYELKDAVESLSGVSQQQIDDTADLIFQYEQLTAELQNHTDTEIEAMIATGKLTSEQQVLVDAYQRRKGVMSQLDAIYPSLLDKDGKAIKLSEQKVKAVKEEQRANEVLLKAYKNARDGKLNQEESATLASAKNTKARIEFLKVEILALEKVMETARKRDLDNNQKIIDKVNKGELSFQIAQPLMAQIYTYSSNVAELDKLMNSLSTSVGKLSIANDRVAESSKNSASASKNSTTAKEKENKETEKSIYLADLYKRKIDELNLAIEKEIALRNKLNDYDPKYISSQQTQLKLENAKLAAMQAQEKSIQAQIKSGKVQQTGIVKQSEAIKTVTKTMKLSGFQGAITSKYGSRINPVTGKSETHRGTDIAGARGTGIDSFAGGKVVAAGYAGKKGAEKLHSSYGNVVVVQSDDGTKRLYAHMEKVLVKVGDQISAGSKIGTIGSTGNSTGNHLHYEKTQNGKLVNSYDEVMQARKGVTTTTTTGGSKSENVSVEIANTQQNLDKAKSDILSIQGDILAQQQVINDLQKDIVDSALSGFEFKKSEYDKFLENGESRLAKLSTSSEEYRKELEKQATALKAKQAINKAEIASLKGFIASGTLTEKVVAEYTEKLHELGKLNSEIDLSLKGLEEDKLASYVDLVSELTDKYSKLQDTTEGLLSYESALLANLDTNSKKYITSLERINKLMTDKQKNNKQELSDLLDLINTGGYYGEALEIASKRVQELKTEIVQLQQEIQEGNFEILINIKTRADEILSDIQFEIDRSDALRKMYEEGSADYKKYTQTIINQSQLMADQHLATRDALTAELKQQDISIERRKEVIKLIEAEHLAYLNATLAVKNYTKELQESQDKLKKAIADDVINALKAVYQARRDDHIKLIEDELKREEKAHNQRVKQLNDEMNLFRKNVQERLQLIDRTEAERGYNMEIDELESERNKVQSEIDLLALDPTAKSKRKKLQEQLDKIDKDIAEKRHQRDIDLQKQGLNDLLESKEQEIEGKLELEDEAYQNVVDRINKEKDYWEKHYTDLLNDERKFAKLREEIMAGNFANVEKEFTEHIQYLKDSLPGLEDTLDGTMQAVGTSIRQNIIDQLQAAIDKIGEFNSLQVESPGGFTDGGYKPPSISDTTSPNGGSSTGNSSSGSNGTGFGISSPISQGDLEVLAAKYMNENLLSQTNDPKIRAAVKGKADALASKGRSSGSKIATNAGFSTITPSLTSSDKTKLRGFMNAQANSLGDDKLKNIMKNALASLDTGGMLSTSGNGLDGKGGKLFIGHDGEVVNNPLETSQLLKTAELSNSILSKLSSIVNPLLSAMPSLPSLNGTALAGESPINISFGDIYNTSQDSAKRFATQIITDIKTRRG